MTQATIEAAAEENYSITQYKRDGKFICWISKIGFQINSKGERVRCWQYHGKDFAAAQRAVIDLGERWGKVLDKYRRAKRKADFWIKAQIYNATTDGFYLDDNSDKVDLDAEEIAEYKKKLEIEMHPVLPVWEDADIKASQPLNLSDKPDPAKPKVPTVSIKDAKKIYMAAYKARVGLIGPEGIKADTAYSHDRDLRIALTAIDDATPVSSLTKERIEKIKLHWLSPERQKKGKPIKERTRNNYLIAFKQFLDGLPKLSVGYPNDDISDVFSFRKVKAENMKFDPKKAKALLALPDERLRLYQLLALNCGFYQVDIANLKNEEIITTKAGTFIVRKRDKTSHQNDFSSQWWLFPETARLLTAQRTKDKHGLALLRPNGEQLKTGPTDNYINQVIDDVREKHPEIFKDWQFKQWRKAGTSAIKRLTGNPDIARKYGAKVIQGSLADYDRDDFFDDLTDALKQWHKELTKAKVFAFK